MTRIGAEDNNRNNSSLESAEDVTVLPDTVKHDTRCVCKTIRLRTACCVLFLAVGHSWSSIRSLCGVKNLDPTPEGWPYHVVSMVTHPRGTYRVIHLPSLEVATPEIKSTR